MPLQLNCHPKRFGPGSRKWFAASLYHHLLFLFLFRIVSVAGAEITMASSENTA
jgi:hypothetical protein